MYFCFIMNQIAVPYMKIKKKPQLSWLRLARKLDEFLFLNGHGGQLPSAPLGLLSKDVCPQVLCKADSQDLQD
jgi:hypothetical protein